ncbi:MAG: methyl-accepting chemotaxis protein, partial [Mycolicibacterium aromaticivorans]|nr:methyl-accepting chemotaxis protein [Mycolicibacterium aromaticivorans]
LLTVIAALSAIAYVQMRTEIVDGVNMELEAAVRGNREALSRWMAQRRDAIEATAGRLSAASDPIPFLIAGKDAGRFDQTFVGSADKQMIYNLADKKPAEGYDPTARPWYKMASEAKGTVVTAPYISSSTKKLGITVARPVEGSVQAAVVGGDISLEEIVAVVKAIELRGAGYAFLATRDGKIVAHAKPESALKPVAEVLPGFDASILQSTDEKIALREFEIDGSAKYVVTSPIVGVDWVLCAVVDKATILSPLRSLLGVLVFAGLVVALLGAALANLALSRLLKGLFGLRDALTEISSGQGDLTRKLTADSKDEIGQTAAAFNRFIDTLRGMFIEVRENASSLNAGIDSLNGVTRTMAADSERQAETLSSTAATIEEITVSINHIADNAQQAEKTARQTGEVSRHSAGATSPDSWVDWQSRGRRTKGAHASPHFAGRSRGDFIDQRRGGNPRAHCRIGRTSASGRRCSVR